MALAERHGLIRVANEFSVSWACDARLAIAKLVFMRGLHPGRRLQYSLGQGKRRLPSRRFPSKLCATLDSSR